WLCTYYNVGDYTGNARKCSCIVYDVPLTAGQSWCLTTCYWLTAYTEDSSDACSCLLMRCNGSTVLNRSIVNRGWGDGCDCFGTFNEYIDYNDTITFMQCNVTDVCSGELAYAYNTVCTLTSFGNVGTTVTLCNPRCVRSYSTEF
ncbi:unnamed protein product, partial [marine sediment metagenome]